MTKEDAVSLLEYGLTFCEITKTNQFHISIEEMQGILETLKNQHYSIEQYKRIIKLSNLISRDDAIACVWKPQVKPDAEIFNSLKMAIQSEIEHVPAINAVPLESLCQWLAGEPYCEPSQMAIAYAGGRGMMRDRAARVEAWKYYFLERLQNDQCDRDDLAGEEK